MAAPHDPLLLTKACRLQGDAKEWHAGILSVHASRIRWQPGASGSVPPREVPAGSLTTQKARGRALIRLVAPSGALVLDLGDEAAADDVVAAIKQMVQTAAAAPAAAGGAANGAAAAPAAAAGAAPARPPAAVKLPPLELRQRALKDNPDLAALHVALVAGGVVGEDEFWRTHRDALIPPHLAVAQQKRGLSTSMLLLLKPEAHGKRNEVTFNLTPDMIVQIFNEQPHVLRAYKSNVPHNMDDAEFWTRYCQHLFRRNAKRLRRARGDALGSTAADGAKAATQDEEDALSHDEQEKFAMFEEGAGAGGDEASQRAKRACSRAVNPAINLAADRDDGFTTGFGVARLHEGGPALSSALQTGDLLREINRHAELVVQGVAVPSTIQNREEFVRSVAAAATPGHGFPRGAAGTSGAGTSASAAAGGGAAGGARHVAEAEVPEFEMAAFLRDQGGKLSDLHAPKAPQLTELSIKDPGRYFERLSSNGAASSSGRAGGAGAGALGVSALSSTAVMEDCLMPSTAMRILNELSGGAFQGSSELDAVGRPTRHPTAALPPALLAQLRAAALTINELLRYFWASFPLSNAAKVAKVERLKVALEARYDGITDLQRKAAPEEKGYVNRLTKPLVNALDAALQRYDDEKAKLGTPVS